MRKVLGALALVGALWAGQAQAALFTVEVEGIFQSSTFSGDAPDASFPTTPVEFTFTYGFDYGLTWPDVSITNYYGEILGFTINGEAVDLFAHRDAVYSLNDAGPGPATSYIGGTTYTGYSSDVVFASVKLETPENRLFVTGDPFAVLSVNLEISKSSQGIFGFSRVKYGDGLVTSVRSYGETPPVGPGDVPEPATWAMLITGFGLIGGAMRRQRPSLNSFSALN